MVWKIILRNRPTAYKQIWNNVSRNMCEKKLPAGAEKKLTTAEKVALMSASELVRHTVHVSDWNKKILVFAKKYKTTAEIPDILPFAVVDKARNKARVKVANIMMAMTVVGALAMIFLGKRAAERGETVSQMNIDWHREYNEKAKREEEEAAKKKGVQL